VRTRTRGGTVALSGFALGVAYGRGAPGLGLGRADARVVARFGSRASCEPSR